MLFMVIETFKGGNSKAVGERFATNGRMLPDGVAYHASWVDPTGNRCFQIMEASNRESLDAWITRWNDLVDFQVIPVLTSADFWASKRSEQSNKTPTPGTQRM
jgi:uncharacterized protein DUF3303